MPDLNGIGASLVGQLLPPLPASTFLNTTSIKVNGQVIPSQFVVSTMRVYKAVNKIPFAIVTIHDGNPANHEFPASNANIFTPGNQLEISSGYHHDDNPIFKGIIIKHGVKIRQGTPPILEVECKDIAVKLTIDRKNKYYYNKTDSEIIDDIMRGHGINGDSGNMRVRFKEMVQFFATDWDFAVMRAEANGRLVVANDGELKVIEPDFNQEAKFSLNYGTSIFEYEAEMDARDQYPSAKAVAWDSSGQETANAEMNENGAVGGGVLGTVQNVASQAGALADRAGFNLDIPGAPPETDFRDKLGVQNLLLQHSGHLSSEELEQWAGAQYTKSRLAKLRGRVRFQGVADLKPGDMINIQGVGLRHEGKVFVSGLLHEISGGAWFTQVQFGLPQRWFAGEYSDVADPQAGALIPPVNGLQIGVVTALAGDPDSRQRIQVRLPLVDTSGDGMWLRLASQDAGNSRGSVWRPEIGDEVVVGFLNDDPRDGVVLGSLYSSANAAPITADDNNHEKGWITRGEIRMVLNDDKKSIEISTPAGKKITVDEDAGKIQVEDENNNKITMDANGIIVDSASVLKLKAAQSISIEAPEIKGTAQSSLKMEAQGQVQVSSSGDMVIKGSFVRIN